MRAIISALFALGVLFGVSSEAIAQCRELQPTELQQKQKGFVTVAVVLNAPNDEQYERVKMLETHFQFFVAGTVRVKQDEKRHVKTAFHCQLGLRGQQVPKTLIDARAYIVPSLNTDETTALGAMIQLPGDVVARQPAVELTLQSGTELTGVWGERAMNGKRVKTLILSKAE